MIINQNSLVLKKMKVFRKIVHWFSFFWGGHNFEQNPSRWPSSLMSIRNAINAGHRQEKLMCNDRVASRLLFVSCLPWFVGHLLSKLIEAVDLIGQRSSWPNPPKKNVQVHKKFHWIFSSSFFFGKSPTHFHRPLSSKSVTWRWPEVVATHGH